MDKSSHLFSDSLGGTWLLGTETSISHQEDLVPSDVFVALFPCFKPLLKWWAPHPPALLSWEPEGNYYLRTTPTPLHTCTWGCNIKSTETKKCQNVHNSVTGTCWDHVKLFTLLSSTHTTDIAQLMSYLQLSCFLHYSVCGLITYIFHIVYTLLYRQISTDLSCKSVYSAIQHPNPDI